jgi:cytosine/adenosine deaminase-related metal-dependent hydrolase
MNAMTGVDPFDDALVASGELLLSGVTGVQVIFHTFGTPDQYFSSLEKVISGLQSSRIRFRLVLAITDQFEFFPQRSNPPFALPSFVDVGPKMKPEIFRDLVLRIQMRFPEIDFGVAPVAPQWCSDEMLKVISELASTGMLIHTHCLESPLQRRWIEEAPIERLSRFNLLGSNTSLAHAIWLNDDDLSLIKSTGTHLVACPRSNKILKAGRAQISKWMAKEVNIAIGLDSIFSKDSPFEVARIAFDEDQALRALITGGQLATGIKSQDDQVIWSNLEDGIACEVIIDGEKVVSNMELFNHDEFKAAKKRIEILMLENSASRESRHRDLSIVMKKYLNEINK